jgi:hypothetical protein
MRGGGRVLVVERMTFADPVQSIPTLLSDINILVLAGAWSEPVTITLADRDTRVGSGLDEDMSIIRACSNNFDCPMVDGSLLDHQRPIGDS